jgi:glycosyltransferase involved in cell wall biosynthesis
VQPIKASVILGCIYDDWASASELFRTIDRELLQRQWPSQLVLVDDGSLEPCPPDFLKGLAGFSSVEVVRLRRNVGHQRAIAIGLSYIFETKQVESVAIMDSDGEDRPEDLFRLMEAHHALPQPKVIFAERTRRSETVTFRLLYQIYCALHLLLTGYRIRFGNFSIVPRRFLACLVVDPNLWLHFAATVVAGRIPYTTIPTRRGVRLHGKSKLNFTQLVIHGLAAISCYNEIVGVRLFFCALILSAGLFSLILGVIAVRMTTPWAIPGWATYTTGVLSVMLTQVFLIVMAMVTIAISSRKSHFFLPVQQYKLLIDDVRSIH